jgi:ATP-dependent RNA helicase RhlE
MNPSLEEAIIQFGIQEANELQRNTFSTIKSGADCLVIAPENSGKTTLIVFIGYSKTRKSF